MYLLPSTSQVDGGGADVEFCINATFRGLRRSRANRPPYVMEAGRYGSQQCAQSSPWVASASYFKFPSTLGRTLAKTKKARSPLERTCCTCSAGGRC